MKIFNSSQALILATTIFLVFIVSLRAQDSPQDFVAAHNRARAEVGVGPLRWDDRVADYARSYANQRRGDCAFQYSRGPYGENLAWNFVSMSAVDTVNTWLDEKIDYDYDSNTCASDKVCSDYTQVVWRNTVKVGCAKVRCHNGGTFITCNYDPPGNMIGQRPY